MDIGTYRLNDLVDHFNASCYLIFRVSNDEAVKILLRIFSILIGSSFPFLDTAFTTNANFGATLAFHFLETVTTRSNEQTEEVDFRELLDRNINFLGWSLRSLLLMIFDWWTEVGIVLHSAIHEPDALFLELFTVTNFTGICPSTMGVIGRGRGR